MPIDTDSTSGLTIDGLLASIAPAIWTGEKLVPSWPPDVFAIAALLLQRCGAYKYVVHRWPPIGEATDDSTPDADRIENWTEKIARIGAEWRSKCHFDENTAKCVVPTEVQGWWSILVAAGAIPVRDILPLEYNYSQAHSLCEALLQLLAAADEACLRVGVASFDDEENSDSFQEYAENLLNPGDHGRIGSTLCERIDRQQLRVLPKTRTSQRGLTLRSLSLNLCLSEGGEVVPEWRLIGNTRDPKIDDADANSLNLLLVPYPFRIKPIQFRQVEKTPFDYRMVNGYGMFEFRSMDSEAEECQDFEIIKNCFRKAQQIVGHVHGVVFPELALRKDRYEKILRFIEKESPGTFLVSGLIDQQNGFGLNYVECTFPLSQGVSTAFRQSKHHRWYLDRSQIMNYGLASRLDPEVVWWESMHIADRQITFCALESWLSVCFLICEDLARQDPVSELIRSVGPNLVIALLMDGPQLKTRWPSRYATVLADDPGTSVLTLTSLGMTALSRPFDRQSKNRTIALWKDAFTGEVEIQIPNECNTMLLCLTNQVTPEYTADGRGGSDSDIYASQLVLGGLHPI